MGDGQESPAALLPSGQWDGKGCLRPSWKTCLPVVCTLHLLLPWQNWQHLLQIIKYPTTVYRKSVLCICSSLNPYSLEYTLPVPKEQLCPHQHAPLWVEALPFSVMHPCPATVQTQDRGLSRLLLQPSLEQDGTLDAHQLSNTCWMISRKALNTDFILKNNHFKAISTKIGNLVT